MQPQKYIVSDKRISSGFRCAISGRIVSKENGLDAWINETDHLSNNHNEITIRRMFEIMGKKSALRNLSAIYSRWYRNLGDGSSYNISRGLNGVVRPQSNVVIAFVDQRIVPYVSVYAAIRTQYNGMILGLDPYTKNLCSLDCLDAQNSRKRSIKKQRPAVVLNLHQIDKSTTDISGIYSRLSAAFDVDIKLFRELETA